MPISWDATTTSVLQFVPSHHHNGRPVSYFDVIRHCAARSSVSVALVTRGWHQDQQSPVRASRISQLVAHDPIDVQMAQMTQAPKKIIPKFPSTA